MLVAPGGLGRGVSAELRLASLGLLEHVGQPFFGVGTRVGLALAGGHFTREEAAEIAWMASRPGTARAASRTIADVIDVRGQSRHFLDRAAEVSTLPPMSIVWGDRDRVLPFADAAQAAAHVAGAALHRYEGAGHFPHREAAPRFVRDLESFLDASELASPQLARPVRVQVPIELARPNVLVRALRVITRSLHRAFTPTPRPAPREIASAMVGATTA
jgi:pimeloyl-ACP methyl ester carboxylesterase